MTIINKIKNLEDIAKKEGLVYRIKKDLFIVYPDGTLHEYCPKETLIPINLIEFIKYSIINEVLYTR